MTFGGWEDLPDDVTADVLRRLPPRSLAVSRCVCRGWRDLVDGGRLLRADLLPLSVGGIFMRYRRLYSPDFLARPTTGPSISGDLDFIPAGFSTTVEIEDHCNGLLLCRTASGVHDYVANPATRQWARLPRRPGPPTLSGKGTKMKRKEEAFGEIQIKRLVYDPTMSPHYEVFLFHCIRNHQYQRRPPLCLCPLRVHVYSSVTGRWEERLFVPEGCVRVVETIIPVDDNGSKVYWRGALYLLCEDVFFLRLSISDGRYRLIPVPADVGFDRSYGSLPFGSLSLGISKKGVYCASEYDWHGLRIFLLNESSSCGQTAWELKHIVDFTDFSRKLYALKVHSDHQQNGPWMLQDINYYKYPHGNDKCGEVVEDSRFEWNSDDDDNVLGIEEEDTVQGRYSGRMSVLGFHPYKEIVFLNAGLRRAVAYHWNTSKFQDLGNIFPKDYHEIAGYVGGIQASFIYTPCWMDGGLNFTKAKLSAFRKYQAGLKESRTRSELKLALACQSCHRTPVWVTSTEYFPQDVPFSTLT